MNIKLWFLIHKWTSLICTVFLLLLCITGLPLIFHEEIDHYFGDEVEAPVLPVSTAEANIDAVISAAQRQRPSDVVRFVSWDADHHPHLIFISMATTLDAEEDHTIIVDSRTAHVLAEQEPEHGFMHIMFKLHVDLFAGLPGMLFLGVMGLLFAISIISGVILYAPFMRKLDFGIVRTQYNARVKWLDLHNLLGIVTLVWALVVGLTGTINTLGQVVVMAWQRGQLAEMVAPYAELPAPEHLGSLNSAINTARNAIPTMTVSVVAFPGTAFSSRHHYAVFMHGKTPLTSRLLQPALIDAETTELTDTRPMPWYVQTLFLSQPLHFGDYGGLPLKVLWALLDIISIVVLVSGLYLWIGRRKVSLARHVEEIEASGIADEAVS